MLLIRGGRLADDHGDLKVIGNSTPRYEYGFRLGAEFKGVDLSVFFQGVGKRELWGNSSMTIAGFNSSDGAMAQAIAGDFWKEDRTDAYYPRPYNNANSNNTNNMQIQTRYLLDMSYFRLKNLTLGYSLPAKLMRKVNISKLRVYAALENFFTFDHLKGLPIDLKKCRGIHCSIPTIIITPAEQVWELRHSRVRQLVFRLTSKEIRR